MKRNRTEILDAATDLFDREGIGVSTAKVAAAAEVSNGTLFNYFPTKQALLDALYVHLKSQIVVAVGDFNQAQSPQEQLRTIWQRWGYWAVANPAHHRVANLLHGAGLVSADASDEVNALLAPLMAPLAQAHAEGALVALPLDYLASLLQVQLHHAIAGQLPENARADAFHMAWRSISRSN